MVGTIATKYCENTLSDAIDYVLNCMKQMNVKRSDEIDKLKDILGFALYSSGNPDEFCDIVNEANKRGWKQYYKSPDQDQDLEEDLVK